MMLRVLLATSLLVLPASAAPCVTDTPDCTEKISVGGNGRWSLVYRSHSLRSRNGQIRRALIMIHGQGRNADNYFRTAVAAAFLAGALDDTIVISPRFASSDGSCHDALAEGEISYTCTGNSWRSGAAAQDPKNVTSYDFADEILRLLARKDMFPNLRSAVVAGHSAGGQYVVRYAMANRVHDQAGFAIHYVVANPSSYPYLDATRLSPGATCDAKGCTGKFTEYREGRNCTTYNQWPYGMESREGYTAAIRVDDLKRQLAARPVTYLLGELDNLPLAGFDNSCPAMAQGPNRFDRGLIYLNYVRQKIQARHEIVPVPLCGHNARCIFTADAALPVLFPK
jgi:pimeloyl-ACP methyl ester carboxylesterase